MDDYVKYPFIDEEVENNYYTDPATSMLTLDENDAYVPAGIQAEYILKGKASDTTKYSSTKDESADFMPLSPSLAMAYVPFQKKGPIYDENKALEQGTLFAELDKPFERKWN